LREVARSVLSGDCRQTIIRHVLHAMTRSVLCLMLLSVISMASPADDFEIGTVAASDAGSHFTNAYPVIVRISNGRLVTAFSVTAKNNRDSYLAAALSDDGGKTWTPAAKILDVPGKVDADPSILWNGHQVFVYSTTVPIEAKLIASSQMFYVSSVDGKTWSQPQEIELPFRYSVGKRHMVVPLVDGTYAMPFSWDLWAQRGRPARTEGEMDLASGVLKSSDGIHWQPFGYLHTNDRKVTPFSTGGVCEPALVELRSGELLALLRTGTNFLYESRSRDNGVIWTDAKPSPLTGHNTPAALWKLEKHPDEIIVIWDNSPLNRYPLDVAISGDGGRVWSTPREVATSDGPQVSYPNITQASDGTFVAVWQKQKKEGGRDVRYARFTREWVFADNAK
jgi:hypothetical protein